MKPVLLLVDLQGDFLIDKCDRIFNSRNNLHPVS